MSKKLKIINILGKGNGWDELPENPEGEVWGVNDAFLRTRCDKSFHMHDLDVFYEDKRTHSSTKLCITRYHDPENKGMEFYTTVKSKKFPEAIEFPLDEIVEAFGFCYFNSTVDYMLAYAIYQKPDIINLYGINMSVNEEYGEQKPGIEFWTGFAMGKGIQVGFQPHHSSIYKTKDGLLYGYLTSQYNPENQGNLRRLIP